MCQSFLWKKINSSHFVNIVIKKNRNQKCKIDTKFQYYRKKFNTNNFFTHKIIT